MFETTIQSLATSTVGGEEVANFSKVVYGFKGVIYGVRDMGTPYALPGEGYTYVNVIGRRAPDSSISFHALYETKAEIQNAVAAWDSLYLNYISLTNDMYTINNALVKNLTCTQKSFTPITISDTAYTRRLDIDMVIEVQEEYSS